MNIDKFKQVWNKSNTKEKKKFLNKIHLVWIHKGYSEDWYKDFDNMNETNKRNIIEKLEQGEKLHHYKQLSKDEKRILGKRNL